MPVRILIVDDHSVVRQGLRMFLTLDPTLEVVGEAANGADALQQAHVLRPEVVLMDLLMPGVDGIAATQAIRQALPEVEVVALTSVLDDETIARVIDAGAIGYLLKDTEADELRRAVHAAAAGQVQLSPQVAERLLRRASAPQPAPPDPLTPRETEVLRLLALGLSNREIGQELSIGIKTVKTHVSNILSKLDVYSRTQAAVHALRLGLVAIEEAGSHG